MAFGARAYRLDFDEREAAQQRPQPAFDVIEGGGADARVRQGVSPRLVAHARSVVIVAAALTFLGIARVSITTATVSVLSQNAALEGAIEEAEEANSNLRVERSILSSSSRVDRIATQNYGMVPAEGHEVVSLAPATTSAGEADATTPAAPSTASADDDAATSLATDADTASPADDPDVSDLETTAVR